MYLTEETKEYPLLMQKYSGLKDIPKIKMANLPVPVERLEGLETELDFKGIFIKREDLSHDEYGGNKARKYEYQMADILNKKRKRVMTFGGLGSNQVLANAVYCHEFGLQPVGFVDWQPLTPHVRENLLLDHYYGSELIYRKSMFSLILSMLWYYITKRDTYLVWAGASTPLGTLGFVDAAFELKEQVKSGEVAEPDYLFVADGSTGTTAGLTLGCELAGLKTKIFGVLTTELLVASKK
ncbi:MAG: pyridoxal-phosphate dependent enzyme, partial [Candidatus Lokiarchaeota archaeon]|nr:pyridoxal-phosphate dependent enzyme [Candidatus Lokiarchaeota archaeon]